MCACQWTPWGIASRLPSPTAGTSSIQAACQRPRKSGRTSALTTKTSGGGISPSIGPAFVIVRRSRQELAQLLGDQHQGHAGDEAVEGVEAEPRLEPQRRVLVVEEVERQQRGADGIEDGEQLPHVAAIIEPMRAFHGRVLR